jgi:predicted RNase H-like nuclease
MRMGFALYARLDSLGYYAFPTQATQDQPAEARTSDSQAQFELGLKVTQAAPLQSLEVYPHASFCALLGLTPFPKYTLEGRIQRQLALHEQEMHIPDPMRLFEEITRYRLLQGQLPLQDLYSPGELDALVAAFTAWKAANQPGEVTLIGDSQEGQVVLPVKELKRQYE